MRLKCNRRKKDGKEHCYWSLVESQRSKGNKVIQHTVLYLGEINDSQRQAWIKAIEVFDEQKKECQQLKLFAAGRPLPEAAADGVQVRLNAFEVRRPRKWGGCWLFCQLWEELGLKTFWQERLCPSRKGTNWEHVLELLVCYRLLEPGSEWRLHRYWYEHNAMGDLLGEDFSIAAKDTLYRALDLILPHKEALFKHLRQRWEDLFGVKFDILLYDLTSTYFEADASAQSEESKKRFGYSRDKRNDCVQVVIGLVVSAEGFPMGYEVMAGNTSDKATLKQFLKKIEEQYGKAERIWIMDRGIPTEEVLQEMRKSEPPVYYLVGTPKGRLSQLEEKLSSMPWKQARRGVKVKLLDNQEELYVLAHSQQRVCKERAIRQRQLKKLWKRLGELSNMKISRDALLLKLGSAQQQCPAAWRLVEVQVGQATKKGQLSYCLNKEKLKMVRRREGCYLLRTNLCSCAPEKLWELYILLSQIEEAFKNLKGDLSLRPIYHQLESRIEAHIFVAFLAYCVQVTLRHRLKLKAPGLTPSSVLEQLQTIQMLDVWFPTIDKRWLVFKRYTMPNAMQKLLIMQLGLQLPAQAPPRLTSKQELC